LSTEIATAPFLFYLCELAAIVVGFSALILVVSRFYGRGRRVVSEEKHIETTRRRFITYLLWAIPAATLGLTVWQLKDQLAAASPPSSLPSVNPTLAQKFRGTLEGAVDFKPVGKEGKVLYYEAYNSAGMLIGYAFDVTAYAPTDTLEMIGIVDLNYKVVAVDIEQLSPELRNPEIIQPTFAHEFVGLSEKELFLSPQGHIDAVTGATLSSGAVTDAVRGKVEEITGSAATPPLPFAYEQTGPWIPALALLLAAEAGVALGIGTAVRTVKGRESSAELKEDIAAGTRGSDGR
jgi:hypothetical protein